MSKRISLIVLAVILVITMVIPSTKVYAANKKVNTVEAVYESGKLTVSGSVEEGMLAVAVQVLDSDNNLVVLETGAVNSSNEYKVEIEVPEGTYTIKVADYEGGDVTAPGSSSSEESSEEVTEATTQIEAKDENKKESTPGTGDNIMIFMSIFALAVFGIFVVKKLNRKTVKGKRTRKH